MSVDIRNVVNVQLFQQATTAQADNVNVIAMFTSEIATGIVDSFKRTQAYFSINEVANDFGTTSQTYQFAQAFFAQSPNPVSAGGYLVIAHWRATDFNAPATSAVLTGAQLSEASVIPQLQVITDGSFDIDVDGVTQNVTGLDFTSVGTLEDVAGVLDTALSGASCTEDDQKLIITSDTTGVTSLITFASTGASGTDVSQLLSIASGTGATIEQGKDAEVLTAESKEDAVLAAVAEQDFISFGFIDNPTDTETQDLADYAQTQDNKLYWDVFDSTDNLDKDITNIVWELVLNGNSRTQMMYKIDGDRRVWLAAASRGSVVNFNAESTANTLANKELNLITPDDISEADLQKAEQVGLKVYTSVKNVPNLFEAGRNSYFDNEYNTISLIDEIQTDTFNLLHGTNTKIPQTTGGLLQITDSIKKTLDRYVRNGVIAAGTWTLPDTFGDVEVFNREIETVGYYVLPTPLALQTTAERDTRVTPPIQVAVKFSGAVHKVDIILSINY